jgi:hypothetical protein
MPFDPMHNEMMNMDGGHHGHHGGASVLDEGAEYVVAEFQVSGAGEFVEVARRSFRILRLHRRARRGRGGSTSLYRVCSGL